MGGINSACLKPRSTPNESDNAAKLGGCERDNESKNETLDVDAHQLKAAVDARNTTTKVTATTTTIATTTTTMTTIMKNGDAVMGGAEVKAEKPKKRRKKRELSHAFQLTAFQSQDDVANEASRDRASLPDSDG